MTYIVSPIHKTRRITPRTKGEFKKIEKYIFEQRGDINTVQISRTLLIKRVKVSQALRRLHSLGVIHPIGKKAHEGRGRPMTVWER